MIIRKNKQNDSRINCAFLMLFILPFQNLLNAVANFFFFNLGEIDLLLIAVIWIYGVIIILSNPIKKNNFLWLGLIYIAYIVLYIVSDPLAKKEFLQVGMWIIYIYYIPLSVFIVSKIDAWDNLFTKKVYILLSDALILLSLFTKVFLNDQTEYMDYSYALLPFWGIVAVSGLYFKKSFQKLMIPVIFIQALVYGCRGALISIVFVIVVTYLKVNYFSGCTKKIYFIRILKSCVVIGIAILGIKMAIGYLGQLDVAETSYILRRIQMGIISENGGRNILAEMCFEEMKKMGLNINGLFYDRLILPNGMYSHNFVLEIFISLGWIIGTFFLGWIICSIIIQYIRQGEKNRIILICFTGTLFFRYFISGSIFSEGKFILFMAIVLSFKNLKSRLIIKI